MKNKLPVLTALCLTASSLLFDVPVRISAAYAQEQQRHHQQQSPPQVKAAPDHSPTKPARSDPQ